MTMGNNYPQSQAGFLHMYHWLVEQEQVFTIEEMGAKMHVFFFLFSLYEGWWRGRIIQEKISI
jgi:hypothetical protein